MAKSPWQRSVLFWCQDQPDSHNSLLGEGAQERDTLFGFGHIPRIDSGRYKQINDLGRGENCEFCLYWEFGDSSHRLVGENGENEVVPGSKNGIGV